MATYAAKLAGFLTGAGHAGGPRAAHTAQPRVQTRSLFSRRLARTLGFLGLATALGACAIIPRGAPLQSEVTRAARGDGADFAVYPVTRASLPAVASWDRASVEHRIWVPHSHRGGLTIQPGDSVDMVIWDAEPNSLLTSPDQKSTQLQGLQVDRAGMVFVPYLDKIRVAGLSPDSARQRIQRQMEDIIPSAQVQLTVSPGARQQVDVVSGVARPGTFTLDDPDGHASVLGVISQAGGVSPDLRNPQVALTRSGRVYRIALGQLYDNPGFDTVLRGRDKIIVEEDDRYFRSLGAVGKETIIPFDRARISALDAVAMIEGLQDGRADPGGVLILREYDPAVVRAGGPTHQRTIFSVDLTNADGLFSAGKFLIQPQDTVVVTEAPTVAIGTIIGLFTDGFRAINQSN